MSNRKSSLLKQSSIFKIENGIIKGEEYPFMDTEDNNYGETLLKKMKSDPDFIAQIEASTGEEDTFGEMAERSIRCALWMKSRGLKPGDVVAICTDNHLDSIIPCLASLYIGVVFNPWWDHGLTKDIARHFVNLTKPKILFTNKASAKIGIEVANEENVDLKIVVFGCEIDGTESFREIINIPKTKEVENFQCTKFQSAKHPAFILYTSGTTGLPKGVLHSHESIFGNIDLIEKIVDNNCTSLWYSSLCWVTGLVCPLSSIYQGNKRIIARNFTGNQLCELVEKYKINWIIMSTSLVTRFLTSGTIPNHDMSSVHSILGSGSILAETTQIELKKLLPTTRIFQVYGMTEFGGITVRQTNNKNMKSIGTVAGNIQFKIIDLDSGKILGPNETGEACFKSPFMMTEYYNNPEKTKEAIDSDGWLHTGDLCYYDEDGSIFIIDRLKELMKWRGLQVSPAVFEQLIQTYPGVTEAAVVGVPHYEDDELAFAFVSKRSDANVTEEDIKKLVEDKLPEHMRLRAGVQFLDQIPHTASGKIARSELKKIALAYARKN